MHHPWRRNVTTSMVGLKNGHIRKNLTKNREPQSYSWEHRRRKRRRYVYSTQSRIWMQGQHPVISTPKTIIIKQKCLLASQLETKIELVGGFFLSVDFMNLMVGTQTAACWKMMWTKKNQLHTHHRELLGMKKSGKSCEGLRTSPSSTLTHSKILIINISLNWSPSFSEKNWSDPVF